VTGDVNGQGREPCIAVVGMHRSGTSATAGLLIGLGLEGPRHNDLVPGDSSNERGHWESHEVQLCNARLLAAEGATTYAPPPFKQNWSDFSGYEAVEQQAKKWFAATYTGRSIVIKDPRLCLTMPFWREALPTPLGAVFVLRDPMHVARSLQARDDIPITLGLALWDRYIRSANEGLAGLPVLVAEYDSMIEHRAETTESMAKFLGHLGIESKLTTPDDAATRLDPGLRHQTKGSDDYSNLDSSQRDVLKVLTETVGQHSSWQPAVLPPPPAWVDDVLRLRRDYAGSARELHWVKASRAYKMVSSIWRVTGKSPTTLVKTVPGQEEAQWR
jgi:hypothetical protein